MKKTLLIAALTLASTGAFASKARLGALSSSPHLSDIQDIFTKPDRAASMGEWATAEFGTANTSGKAEGGFVRMAGDAAWGAYLGHLAPAIYQGGTAAAGNYRAFDAALLNAENPFNLVYGAKAGDLNWGLNFNYSKSDMKSTKKKQDAMGLVLGASSGAWDAHLGIGLANNASKEVATVESKLTGKTTIDLGAGYWMDTMYMFLNYAMGGAKYNNGTTDTMDRGDSTIKLGVVNDHKKDGMDFFYGAALQMTTLKDDATAPTSLGATVNKITKNTLPVWFGIEAEAASWLVLRASVTQNFGLLFNSQKSDTTAAGGESDTVADSTTASAGLGMKWNKWMFDGTLSSATDATGRFGLDQAGFLANASVTYNF